MLVTIQTEVSISIQNYIQKKKIPISSKQMFKNLAVDIFIRLKVWQGFPSLWRTWNSHTLKDMSEFAKTNDFLFFRCFDV